MKKRTAAKKTTVKKTTVKKTTVKQPLIAVEVPFTIKVMKNNSPLGTLLVTEKGVQFLPKNYKKPSSRIMSWEILASLEKSGLFG